MRDARRRALGRAHRRGPRLDPAAPALEFERRWYTWGELGADASTSVAALVAGPGHAGRRPAAQPAGARSALLLGVLRAGGVRRRDQPAARASSAPATTSRRSTSPCVAGEPRRPRRARRRRQPRSTHAVRARRSAAPSSVDGRPRRRPSPRRRPGVAVRMLTSGTTGPPKRIDLTYETLERVLVGAKHYESQPRRRRCACAPASAIVNSPLVHLGGLFRVLQCVNDGRSFCAARAVHGRRAGSTPCAATARAPRAWCPPRCAWCSTPTSIRADLAQRPLGGVGHRAARRPTTPTRSSSKYGVPVLDLVRRHRVRRRRRGLEPRRPPSSSGRRSGAASAARTPGCELRVVDPTTARVLGADEEGLLEVKAGQLGDDAAWIRTTDLARIDADGFLWILGRADQAIIRGGFKVRPDDVRAALERASRACAARRWSAAPTRASARCRSPPSSCAPARDAGHGRRAARARRRASLARYELPDRDPDRRRAAAHRLGQGRPRRRAAAPRPLAAGGLTDGPALLRRGRGLPRRGPRLARGRGARARPAAAARRLAGAPRLRHRLAAQALRRRLRRAGVAGRVRRPRPARSPSSSSTSRSTRAPTRPTSASTSSA